MQRSRHFAGASLAGAGITCIARELVASHPASGALVSLLNDWRQSNPGMFLHYPGRQTSAAVRAFIDFAREHVPVA